LKYVHNVDQISEDIILQAIYRNPMALQYAPSVMKSDRNVVLSSVSRNWRALQYANDELRNDRDIVMAAVTVSGEALQYASEELKNDTEVVMRALNQDLGALNYVSEKLKYYIQGLLMRINKSFEEGGCPTVQQKVRTYVMRTLHSSSISAVKPINGNELMALAIAQDWELLQYAPQELKNDRDVVLTALNQSWQALQYASNELKSDRHFVLRAGAQSADVLQYASDELKNDREFVLIHVQQSWKVLQFASNELKNDRDIVLTAVNQNWLSLAYAANKIKNDREIILAAVNNRSLDSWKAIQFIDCWTFDTELAFAVIEKLSCDYTKTFTVSSSPSFNIMFKVERPIVLEILNKYPLMLLYAPRTIKQDHEAALIAVSADENAFQFTSPQLQNDKEFCLCALQRNWRCIHFMIQSENEHLAFLSSCWEFKFMVIFCLTKLKNDNDIMLTQYANFLVSVCCTMQPSIKNAFVTTKKFNNNGTIQKELNLELAYELLSESGINQNFNVMFEAVKQDGRALYWASDELKSNQELVVMAVRNDWRAYKDAYPFFKFNKYDMNIFETKEVIEKLKMMKTDQIPKDFYLEHGQLIKSWDVSYSLSVDTVINTFLLGSSSRKVSASCKLSKLRKLGKYGLLKVNQMIAEYAGLQRGGYYRLIVEAKALIKSKTSSQLQPSAICLRSYFAHLFLRRPKVAPL
jgi:hypothetical protein